MNSLPDGTSGVTARNSVVPRVTDQGSESSTDPVAYRAQVESELSRIRSSHCFSNCDGLTSMLEVIVRTHLDSPQENQKELTIGLEVFGRDFDPQKSAKVRTYASRLRAKLAQYYQTEGEHDPVVIEIPKGHYAPSIIFREPSLKAPEASPERRKGKSRFLLAIPASVALTVLAIFSWLTWQNRSNGNAGPGSPVRLTFEGGLAGSPAISRDGSFVVYASDRGTAGNLVLWNQDLKDRSSHQITGGVDDDYDPDISPDLKTIIFRSERDGGGIYGVAITGGPPQPIAKYGRTPRFSPDGKWIVYWEGEPYFPTARLYLIPAQGGAPRPLQARFYGARYGTWLPDSRHILFWGGNESSWDWWVTSVNDSSAVKTGAAEVLRGLRIEYPVAFTGDRILFSASDESAPGSATNLWTLRMDPDTWKITGKPHRITSGSGHEVQASATSSGAIVFSNQRSSTNLWEIPLQKDGSVGNEECRLTDYVAREHSPSVSRDRSLIAFSSDRSGMPDVWIRDTVRNNEFNLKLGTQAAFAPRIAPDGNRLAYSAGTKNEWPIFIKPVAHGSQRMICGDCGAPRAWSSDQEWLLYETKQNEPYSVGILNTSTGEHAVIASAAFPTYPDHFSADGKWFSFHARNTNRTRVLYVAPFRGLYEIPQQDWIPVTDGKAMDREGVWSPDQAILYFLSERDGFRCIWAQSMDRDTQRPVGRPWPVRHFHRARYSLLRVGSSGDVGLTVAQSRITFSLADTTGNIWLAWMRTEKRD